MPKKTIKFAVPKSVNLSKKQYLLIASCLVLAFGFFGLVTYKYMRLRTDYGRVISLLYEEDEVIESSPESDNTYRGRHSAQKYMDDVFQDPKLVEITQSLGIHKNNIQGLEMRIVDQASIGTLPDGTQPNIDPDGVFFAGYYNDNKFGDVERAPKIEVESHLNGEELRRVVAHEFMHHMYAAWWNQSLARRYDQALLLFYMNNSSIRNRVSSYIADGRLSLTEVYAYACTEYSDRALGAELTQICGQWFDRSKLSYIY